MDRSSSEVLALRVPLVAEMAAGDLGDRRLNARRDRLIATLEQHPDAGFPEACANDSEAEALYRFLRNDRLSLESLLGPHVVATAARCQALEEVLVVHDTTEMSFGGERARMGLTAVGPRHQAFWLHASLAVSAEGLRAPLGVIALAPFTRGAAPGPAPTWRERYDDAAKESRRWTTGVRAVRERCGPTVQVIHVMDREGDSYELFTELLAADERFVVRLAHDRRLTSRDDGSPEKLGAALAHASICFEQTVEVAARRGARPPQARKKHPPRAQRAAHLRIAARQVTFRRPGDLRDCDLPPGLTVNVVRAWEEAPPADQEPIEWRLVTTEPIATATQVRQVIDWYRTRWLIEEYFKCVKTGCAYEQRQLESLDTLLIALGLLAPIAWQLLLMRHLTRALSDARATVALSPRQVTVLRATPAGARVPPDPTVREALLAVARLGGHLRQNGEPGWLVLTRGMQTLLTMEAGWVAAGRARSCDQS